MTVTMLNLHEIETVWPEILPQIERAMAYSNAEDAEGLLSLAREDRAQVWMAGKWGVAVTRIEQGKRRILRIVAVAGEDMQAWIGELVAAWRAFAIRHGCENIVATGRAGWRSEFRKHGFKTRYLTGVCEVANA